MQNKKIESKKEFDEFINWCKKEGFLFKINIKPDEVEYPFKNGEDKGERRLYLDVVLEKGQQIYWNIKPNY